MSFRNKAFFNRSLAGFCYILIIACGWIYFLQCYLLLCAQNLMLPTLLLYMVFTIWSHHWVCYFLYGRYAQISLYCVCFLLGMLFFFLSSDLVVHAAQIPPQSPSPDPSNPAQQLIRPVQQRSDFSVTSSHAPRWRYIEQAFNHHQKERDSASSFLHAHNIFVQSVVSTEHVVNKENNTLVVIDRTDAIDNFQFRRQQIQNVLPKNYFSAETIQKLVTYFKNEGLDDARIHNLLKALPNHSTALNVFKHLDGTFEFRASILTHSSKYGNLFLAENDLDGKARKQFISPSISLPSGFISSHTTPGVTVDYSSRLPISPKLLDNASTLKIHHDLNPITCHNRVKASQNISTETILKFIWSLQHIKKK